MHPLLTHLAALEHAKDMLAQASRRRLTRPLGPAVRRLSVRRFLR
jgi:hypothetical protein